MADIATDEEFLSRLKAAPAQDAATTVLPEATDADEADFIRKLRSTQVIGQLQTGAMAGGALEGANRPMDISINPPPKGIERFARDGIPLDTTTGVPGFWKRTGLSFGDDEDRINTLRQMFNNSVVDNADGHLIVRNVLDPKTGSVKDLLMDEQDLSLGDLGDFSKAGLQWLAEAFALKGMGKLTKEMGRFGRLATEASVGAATSEVTGGGLDIAARSMRDQPLRFADTGREILKGSIQSTLLGGAMGGVIEGGAGLFDMASGRATGALRAGADESAGMDAIRRLNLNAPEDEVILPTLGQMAENPDVLRLETVMSKLPLIGRLFRAPMEAQEAAIRAKQRRIVGNEPMEPLSDLGASAVQTLRTSVDQPGQIAKEAETSLIERATGELDTALQRMSPQAHPFTAEGATALTKLSIRAQHTAFRNHADELFEEAGNPIINTSRMQQELARIREDLPKRTVINESQIVDVRGQPLATTEGRELINELVPDKLNRLMRGLDQLDPQMPLSELRRIRNTIDSAIIDGRGLPEVSTHELTQLRGAITRTIDDGIEQIGDPAVATALRRANTFYREGIDRFEVPFIARLLKENPNQPGFMRGNELLTAIQANPDDYLDLERFMRTQVQEGGQAIGPASGRQFDVLRRAISEEIFSRARVQPGATAARINADKVLAELGNLKSRVRASLLGGEAEVIDKNLDLLRQLKGGYKDIPEDQLRTFLNRPNNTVHDLSRIVVAVKQQREDFANGLLKKFLKGDIEAGALAPEKLIDWLLNHNNAAEVADVMAKLSSNPQLVQQLQRKALVGFLQKARAPLRSGEAAHLDDVSEVLAPAKLIDMMKDETKRSILRNVVGDEAFNFIRNFTEAQTVLGKHTDTGSASAGGWAATSALLDILKLAHNLPTVGKHIIFSTVMTNRDLRRAIMEQSLRKPLDTATFTRYVLASTPMLEALGEEFGKSGADFIIENVLGSVRNEEGLQQRGAQQPAQQ